MDFLLKVVVIWLSVDIVLIATIWYSTVTIKKLWPDWWTQNVATAYNPVSGVKNF